MDTGAPLERHAFGQQDGGPVAQSRDTNRAEPGEQIAHRQRRGHRVAHLGEEREPHPRLLHPFARVDQPEVLDRVGHQRRRRVQPGVLGVAQLRSVCEAQPHDPDAALADAELERHPRTLDHRSRGAPGGDRDRVLVGLGAERERGCDRPGATGDLGQGEEVQVVGRIDRAECVDEPLEPLEQLVRRDLQAGHRADRKPVALCRSLGRSSGRSCGPIAGTPAVRPLVMSRWDQFRPGRLDGRHTVRQH